MSATFKQFLVELEQSLSFDPSQETPDELVKRAKDAHRMASNQPERAIRRQQMNIKDKTKEIKADVNDGLQAERLRIKRMEEQLAKLKMALANQERMAERRK